MRDSVGVLVFASTLLPVGLFVLVQVGLAFWGRRALANGGGRRWRAAALVPLGPPLALAMLVAGSLVWVLASGLFGMNAAMRATLLARAISEAMNVGAFIVLATLALDIACAALFLLASRLRS